MIHGIIKIMHMKKNLFLLGIALTTWFSSCKDDNVNIGVENPVQTGEEILFGSSLTSTGENPESRTEYGVRDDKGVNVQWATDGSDEIAIFCLQASQPANHLVKYKVDPSKTDPAVAETVTKVNPEEAGLQWGAGDEHRFYAFYPADAVKGSTEENETGKITAKIPVTQQVQSWREVQAGGEGCIDGMKTYFGLPNMDYAYMYAFSKVSKSEIAQGGSVDLQFHNLVTVLDITVRGPEEGNVTVTNINVSAISGNPILTGDFTCNIRAAEEGKPASATCEAAGDLNQVRNMISIPCYDRTEGKYITLGKDECLNVKAYLIPDDNNSIDRRTLKISVATLNGGAVKERTLEQAAVTPHMINRILLPKLIPGGTNYWMSSLDPNIYVSELSIPGSKFSVLTSDNGASPAYQNVSIEKQFQDGVRAFIFQTATKTKSANTTYDGMYVMSDDRRIKTLSDAIMDVASYLAKCESEKKYNEFAFILLTYQGGQTPIWEYDEQYWINHLNDEINNIKGDSQYRIYTGEITPNTTIDDVKGKIILKANYNSKKMINGYNGTAPILFSYWDGFYGPEDGNSYYQDKYQGMPMNWKTPEWYESAPNAKLRWYYQEATHVGTGTEATKEQKETYIKKLFTESVNLYKNDVDHKTWFMNDLGGEYISGNNTTQLATDMNNLGVRELQNRTENAGLGLVFMNFADKQSTSGALYKSDWLIQTLIDNNFKFALRKKGSTTTYDSSYTSGGSVIE